ncbi:MAG: polyprenyl synthetase family protein [Defluviitaleaceae bacterium]|nr:polyprenyl synthetase family protein [Defluviitaleaceae bacterium]
MNTGKTRISQIRQQVNDRLAEIVNHCTEPLLKDAMLYSLLGGGKRLRPLLLISTCETACGEYSDNVLNFACSLEMIHSYSLIHDDLPAMDNDDIRHGKPTNHKQYSEAVAILAGDALLNTAFETMAKVCYDITKNTKNTDKTNNTENFAKYAKAMAIIAAAAGQNGMIAGQIQDITNQAADIATLTEMHSKKTGKLFLAALKVGAILADATPEYTAKITDIGKKIGTAFQMLDDILDITASPETLGKPINSDIRNNKTTYVTLKGIQAAKLEYATISQEIITQLNNTPQKTSTLQNVIESVLNRDF